VGILSALHASGGAIIFFPAEALNAFYFAPALTRGRAGGGLATLFSTHPSLERRLAELAKISRQLGQ
jgi:heat shock protein HtpX